VDKRLIGHWWEAFNDPLIDLVERDVEVDRICASRSALVREEARR